MDRPPMALFGCQIENEILRDHRVAIYALTSRYDGIDDIDGMCGDAYAEMPTLGPATKGLPISGKSCGNDIARALRHVR
jgi:hypothetical protein